MTIPWPIWHNLDILGCNFAFVANFHPANKSPNLKTVV